jgi:hypothetical protein
LAGTRASAKGFALGLRYGSGVRATNHLVLSIFAAFSAFSPFAVFAAFAALAGCRHREGVAGQSTISGPPARVARFAQRPVVDGRLDEAVWQTATVLGSFVDTNDGREVSAGHPVAATARIGWDDERLYLGFVVADGQPTAPFRRDDPDPHLWGSASAVEVVVQPGDPGDNRDYYEIQVDTAGAVFDTHWDDYMTPLQGSGTSRLFGSIVALITIFPLPNRNADKKSYVAYTQTTPIPGRWRRTGQVVLFPRRRKCTTTLTMAASTRT